MIDNLQQREIRTAREQLDRLFAFVRRALRHFWLATLIVCVGGAAAVGLALVSQRKYMSETVILYRELIDASYVQGSDVRRMTAREVGSRLRELVLGRPRLRQLIHMPERSEAITQAKSLQSNWKAAGSLWRSKEQELWNQFREHLDPLFSELKEQQETIRSADKERLTAQKALCDELKAILKSDTDLPSQHGLVQGLQDSWKDIEHPDRKLVATFQAMVTDYQEQVKLAHRQRMNTDRDRWWLKSALLHELTVSGRTAKGAISKKTRDKVDKTWPDDSSDDGLEAILDQACRDVLAADSEAGVTDDAEDLSSRARLLCIRLEFVAGLQSPEEDRQQRMQYQVDRLAESMSGESARQPAKEEARDSERIWLGMYALPESEFKSFGKRVKLALTTIMEH
ncbi:MAG: DUF349 domain-containing protein [Deltaproteobacteria bacterium]|nr:DUF349 domain-containing protein [Deltaproteobacteria bacterium]